MSEQAKEFEEYVRALCDKHLQKQLIASWDHPGERAIVQVETIRRAHEDYEAALPVSTTADATHRLIDIVAEVVKHE